MKFFNDIQFIATGSIDPPPTGFIAVYLKTDGLLYAKKPNGTEFRIS